MTRQHHPYINPESGLPECLYAGCGWEIPGDHFLCRRHYAQKTEGLIKPCPGLGCRRFKSVEYDFCVDCSKLLEAESDPAWDAGDAGCQEFYAYLLVNPTGEWYAGHTRDLRCRMWMHRMGRCRATQDGDYRLAWFEVHPTRSAAAERELEIKRLATTDPYAVLELVFAFQDRIALVRPLEGKDRD